MERTEKNQVIQGIGASRGIGIGHAVWSRKERPEVPKFTVEPHAVDRELGRLDAAIQEAVSQIERLREWTANQMGEAEAQIFDAHLQFLQDPSYTGAMRDRVMGQNLNAEFVCESVTEETRKMLASLPDDYLQARADDIRDVGDRLLILLSGKQPFDPSSLPPGSVVVAHDIAPSDMARFPKGLAGIVTAKGSTTGHAAIMARTLGVPAVLGVREGLDVIQDGDLLILDGEAGLITVQPDEETAMQMRQRQTSEQAAEEAALREASQPACTLDGQPISVFANIGNLGDVQAALENGAEGVGLFRTEFLYLENHQWPTEEEQFQAYRKVLESFGERPVIIRTLDIGGDKELPYAKLPREENPFLGHRAIRFCLSNPDIFQVQLRALLRASVYGTLWIMFPMVCTVEEVLQAKSLLESCRASLSQEGQPVAENIPVGIMVETPAAAVTADILAAEVDFMSIGTNDLTQYTLAADRGNEMVAHLYHAYHPAVLRLIHGVCQAANGVGIPVGVCGELAGDPKFTEVLIGLGVTELSMNARAVPKVKQKVHTVSTDTSRTRAETVLQQKNADAVTAWLHDNNEEGCIQNAEKLI